MSSDIETQARSLLLKSDYGTLSTHSTDYPGYPFASIVPIGFDDHCRPILLISRLAQHTLNIAANPRLSLFLSDACRYGYEDVQTCSRITLLAQATYLDVEREAHTIARYCRFYRQAESYYQQLDFDFYRLEPEKVRFIAGFGQIHWVAPEQLFTPNPLGFDAEAEIITHMNSDHCAALSTYCQQTGFVLSEGYKPQMVGVDASGFHLRVADRIVRLEFPRPIEHANQVRKALMDMLKG